MQLAWAWQDTSSLASVALRRMPRSRQLLQLRAQRGGVLRDRASRCGDAPELLSVGVRRHAGGHLGVGRVAPRVRPQHGVERLRRVDEHHLVVPVPNDRLAPAATTLLLLRRRRATGRTTWRAGCSWRARHAASCCCSGIRRGCGSAGRRLRCIALVVQLQPVQQLHRRSARRRHKLNLQDAASVWRSATSASEDRCVWENAL